MTKYLRNVLTIGRISKMLHREKYLCRRKCGRYIMITFIVILAPRGDRAPAQLTQRNIKLSYMFQAAYKCVHTFQKL